MKTQVALVNAFTANGTGGNLAGVVLDASSLTAEQMLSIATQVGASETAFVFPDTEATCQLRFFTPTVEVSLCGHATIATWWLMHEHGLRPLGEYTQKSLDGIVNISLRDDGNVFMEQPAQQIKGYVQPEVVADALGITVADLRQDLKPQIVQNQLVVGLISKELLHTLTPDLAKIKKISIDHDFFGFHVYSLLENRPCLATVRNFARELA